MKKEKTIRTYQRKTKSGKITTVKSHTAKYDAAAEVAKKAARKKGAGGELQAKITKMPDPKLELQQYLDELKKSRSGASSDTVKTTKPAPKKKQTKPAPKSSGLSSTEFKAWYHDPKSKEGRAAAKKLKEQVGAEKYKELNKKANDSYSSRGHISLFKSIGSDSTSKAAPKKPLKKPVGGGITGLEPNKKITTKSKTPKLKDVGPLSTGKVMRFKADIPAKLAKSYATFEDIPLKQAYDELMVASKKDYRRTVAFHKGHY